MGDICYQMAAQWLLDRSDDKSSWRIVHGVIDREGGRVPHAWLKSDGAVFDPTLGETFAAADYEEAFGALENRAYTLARAQALFSATGHWGPWQGESESH